MLKPLYDKILIDPNIQQFSEEDSGLIVYEDKNQPKRAKVIAVGDGRVTEHGELFPLLTKVGDIVLIPNFGGITIFDDGHQYILIREADVLGRVV